MTKTRNREVVNRFVESDYPHSGYGSVKSSENGSLYSYNAKIAEWDDGEIVVYDEWDGHSVTTSKHFKFLYDALQSSGVPYTATHSIDENDSAFRQKSRGKHKSRWY